MGGAMTVCARCLGAGWLSIGVICHSCDGCGFHGRYLGCTCDEPCFVGTHRADLCDEGVAMRAGDLGGELTRRVTAETMGEAAAAGFGPPKHHPATVAKGTFPSHVRLGVVHYGDGTCINTQPWRDARTVEANMGAPVSWRQVYARTAEAGFVVRLLVTEHAREWAVECRRHRPRQRAGQPRPGVPPWEFIGGVREMLDVVEAVVGDELVGKCTVEDDTRRALHAAIGDAVGLVFDVWVSRAERART